MICQNRNIVSRSYYINLAFTLIWMVVIFAFSHQAHSGRITEEYLGDANIPVRKLAHMTEFALLYILTFRTLFEAKFKALQSTKLLSLTSFILTVGYAASDEWHQSFVPGRSSQLTDVLVDATGALAALLLVWGWRQLRSAKSQKQNQN